jgi:hypothetical protein
MDSVVLSQTYKAWNARRIPNLPAQELVNKVPSLQILKWTGCSSFLVTCKDLKGL